MFQSHASTAPRWSRRKQARPSELIDAALDLFVEKGYAATRLDDVAGRAGVSKGTLYLYFPNKEELFKAVVRQAIVPNLERGEQMVAHYPGTSRALIRDIIGMWWSAIGSQRIGGIPKLMLAECGNFPELARFYYEEVIQRGQRIFTKALRRGIDRGEFRKLDVKYALRVMIAPMIFALLWRHSFACCERENLNMETFLDTHIDLLLNGLCAAKRKERGRS